MKVRLWMISRSGYVPPMSTDALQAELILSSTGKPIHSCYWRTEMNLASHFRFQFAFEKLLNYLHLLNSDLYTYTLWWYCTTFRIINISLRIIILCWWIAYRPAFHQVVTMSIRPNILWGSLSSQHMFVYGRKYISARQARLQPL